MPKKIDLTNQRFGKLVVLRRAGGSRNGSVLWSCRCDCGNEHIANTRHLNRNKGSGKHVVRSCGCLQTRQGSENPHFKGVGEIGNSWWARHVVRAGLPSSSRRVLEVNITQEYMWGLFQSQGGRCYFSGEPLKINNNYKYNTASIDRIDNSLGYVVGNVRWVHKHVNIMKNKYDDEYFIDLCIKVSGRHNR